jgi:hypothetical protein
MHMLPHVGATRIRGSWTFVSSTENARRGDLPVRTAQSSAGGQFERTSAVGSPRNPRPMPGLESANPSQGGSGDPYRVRGPALDAGAAAVHKFIVDTEGAQSPICSIGQCAAHYLRRVGDDPGQSIEARACRRRDAARHSSPSCAVSACRYVEIEWATTKANGVLCGISTYLSREGSAAS